MPDWISLGAHGTTKIVGLKTKLKGDRQKNTICQNDLKWQIGFFKDMEANLRDSGADLKPSKILNEKLDRIQKAQGRTETTFDEIAFTIGELTSLLVRCRTILTSQLSI